MKICQKMILEQFRNFSDFFHLLKDFLMIFLLFFQSLGVHKIAK